MTASMWFAWLLRSDISGRARQDDAEAQKDFVAWWLLFGLNEYPHVWRYGQAQISVAMQAVHVAGEARLPRLLRRLYAARADLQRDFPSGTLANMDDFLCWYRLFGPLELPCAPPLCAAFIAATETVIDGAPRMAWRMVRSIERLRVGVPPNDVSATARLRTWYHDYAHRLLPASPPPPMPMPMPAIRTRPARHGVNLIGYAQAASGLGEDLRSLSRALRAVDYPHVVVDTPAHPKAPLKALPYAASIFCMPAFDMAQLHLTQPPGRFAHQVRIGYWPWELPQFPPAWRDVYDLVEEIWAPSGFVAAAYADAAKPVQVMPPAVHVPAALRAGRRGHRSEESVPYRFIYPFDIRSHLARKNPLALVRAFRAAFAPTDESVRLILRVNGQLELDSGWPAVARAAAADPRIMILSGTWSRADALNTMAACDCLVSPHRAEGFGRNIAEALLLGLQVLATGYAGCMDFLTPDECVAWSPARVAEGAYPFATGMIWAEPDHDDLVDRMQEARAHPKSLPQRRARSKALDDIHAPLHVGRQVAARLTALQNARNSVD